MTGGKNKNTPAHNSSVKCHLRLLKKKKKTIFCACGRKGAGVEIENQVKVVPGCHLEAFFSSDSLPPNRKRRQSWTPDISPALIYCFCPILWSRYPKGYATISQATLRQEARSGSPQEGSPFQCPVPSPSPPHRALLAAPASPAFVAHLVEAVTADYFL